MDRDVMLGAIFAALVCILKIAVQVFTPLFLDCLNPIHSQLQNVTDPSSNTSTDQNSSEIHVPILPSLPLWQRIDPFFGIWLSMGFDTLLFGVIVSLLHMCGRISEAERRYPKRGLVLSGGFQAVSALMYQFSTSGTRTAPYLQGVLGYFMIPMTFGLRYLILRKKPTRRKMICVSIVFMGECFCLIPKMIPGLESDGDEARDGGAPGVWGVIWPIIFTLSLVPHALWNILLEKGTKDQTSSDSSPDVHQLNMAYVMFWNFLGTFTTTLLLFWIDLIPHVGLMPNIDYFFQQFSFNIQCIFGVPEVCGAYQVFVAWGRIITKTSMFVCAGCLVRYGEGASIYALLVAIVTPMMFLVFTLFNEETVSWDPRATMATWFSIGALVVMLPAVIVYNTGPPEIDVSARREIFINTDTEQLLQQSEEGADVAPVCS